MIKKILTIILLTFSIVSFSQKKGDKEWKKIDYADSIQLNRVWSNFLEAIENKDSKKIKTISLKQIDCILCISQININEPPADYIIPIDTFINQSFSGFKDSQVFKAIKKRGVKFSKLVIKNYKPRNLPKLYGKDLVVYEIWVNTYLANEWANGHEGQSNSFQFVKIKNEFKFYGFTSVP